MDIVREFLLRLLALCLPGQSTFPGDEEHDPEPGRDWMKDRDDE